MGRGRYGFIQLDRDHEGDVYFSERRIGAAAFSKLSVGIPVEAEVVTEADGRRQARAVRAIADR
jgi:cold shock CspA family protein